MVLNGITAEEDLKRDNDRNGRVDLLDYAFQGNLDEDEEPSLSIELDANGRPIVSLPKQNPYTATEVEVRLESSTDLRTWQPLIEDATPQESQDGRREIHLPPLNPAGEFFRYNVDLR